MLAPPLLVVVGVGAGLFLLFTAVSGRVVQKFATSAEEPPPPPGADSASISASDEHNENDHNDNHERWRIPPPQKRHWMDALKDELVDPDVLRQQTISGGTVFLTDLVRANDTITFTKRTFTNCDIVGPAVVHLIDSVIIDCDFGATIKDLVWAVDGTTNPQGVIYFVQPKFLNCRFFSVGIVTTPQDLEARRQDAHDASGQSNPSKTPSEAASPPPNPDTSEGQR